MKQDFFTKQCAIAFAVFALAGGTGLAHAAGCTPPAGSLSYVEPVMTPSGRYIAFSSYQPLAGPPVPGVVQDV